MIDIEQGIRFACQKCGACCTKSGYVYLTWDDMQRLSAFLGLDMAVFRKQYTMRNDGWTVLTNKKKQCVFYDKALGCVVHRVKPMQCAAWPFWDYNFKNTIRWEKARKLCPGIGQGRLFGKKRIEKILFNT